MNEFELKRRLGELPRERSPQRELWPAIEAGIVAAQPQRHAGRRSQRHWAPWALAASVALTAVLMWPEAVEQTDSSSGAGMLPIAGQLPLAYQGIAWQADALSIEYRVALAQLAPVPLPDELEPVARELRESEQSLREALRQNPGSTFLLAQLRRTYEQQLRLSQLAAYG